MSSSERLRLIQEEAKHFVARPKCRDASELILMKQAKASKYIHSGDAVAFTKTKNNTDRGLPVNGITSYRTDCCVTQVTSGSSTNTKQKDALIQRDQGITLCENQNFSLLQDTCIDLEPLAGTVCLDHTKPPFSQNTAQLTGFEAPAVNYPPGFIRYFPEVTNSCCNDGKSLIDQKYDSSINIDFRTNPAYDFRLRQSPEVAAAWAKILDPK